ncbi:MAG: Tol-Pal system beta propeller repeat protein TolB [Rhodocyclaceae bacterium]|nr:Tol-Pal system beta propeller repeat protein TolB [Rhodocyclaceae bacterium]
MRSFLRLGAVGLALFFATLIAHAQLAIEITGAGAGRVPIAVADFTGERVIAQALVSVVRADLERSGRFNVLDAGAASLDENATPDYAGWKGKGLDAMVVGSVHALPDGRYETRFRAYDSIKRQAVAGFAFQHTSAQIRLTAHRIADAIIEALTGERGVNATRIAYVVKGAGRYELMIADADGQGAQAALASKEPIMSPAWSPDGAKLAYVSFEQKKPVIYIHDLATGRRHVLANFKGSNSAPAWSPDGKRLAVTLTKDGISQIYLINADGSGATKFSNTATLDTEPQFSPDGEFLYFTSDRGGTPQIYRQALSGGPAQRLTFEGSYNVTPRLSPDGKHLAFITRHEGRFRVALMDLESRQTVILTDTAKDESPSFAPNGRMILFATEVGGRGVLAAVSTDGRSKYRLSIPAADIREPAWGPFPK